jgi:hypothetical protein
MQREPAGFEGCISISIDHWKRWRWTCVPNQPAGEHRFEWDADKLCANLEDLLIVVLSAYPSRDCCLSSWFWVCRLLSWKSGVVRSHLAV